MTADEPRAAALPNVECPDCRTTLSVVDGRQPATDGGDDRPRAPDEDVELRGVDVQCDCCGTDVGVYFFP
jgi:hypothetical protein